eukprot:gene2801-12306_t
MEGAAHTASHFVVQGFPCPEGFPAPCLRKWKPAGSGPMWVNKCNAAAAMQRWNISSNAAGWSSIRTMGSPSVTRTSEGQCLSSPALGTGGKRQCRAGPDVYLWKCDALPSGKVPPEECPPHGFPSAWKVIHYANGTSRIVSAMAGPDGDARCLQVGADDATVVLDECR